jgi:predicted CXXCH cytochrome family protein
VKHSQALLKSGRAPEKTGCEACHGPGGLHTTTSRHTIVAWDKLTSEQANAVCLKCHAERGLSQELWDATAHSQVLTCPDCHEVHRPQKRDFMLRREEGKDCSPCHDDLADKIKAKEHHTLADGALSCGQCHALHGGKESHLLKKPQGELCVTCHDQDVPRPDTHKAKTWRLKHKAEAKGHEPQCYMCHDQESFCNQCHSVKIPHPDNWAEKLHAPEAKAKPGPCLKCHEVAYCQACHDPLPPEIDKLVKDKAAK